MRIKSSASCWPASIISVGLFALTACGGRSAATASPVPVAGAAAAAAAFIGDWQWSHAGAAGSLWVVERERWHLAAVGRGLEGVCDREVTVLSPDGSPFACSQASSYRLRTRYRLRGELIAGALTLTETGYLVERSPCEGEHRGLAVYRGVRDGDALVLRWPDGSQRLGRAAELEVPPLATRAPLTGAYHWTTRTDDPRRGTVVEREAWQLVEAEDGSLRGSYLRRVAGFQPDGSPQSCDGALGHDHTDRIEVTGVRIGDELTLRETGGEFGAAPCRDAGRTLDAATGTVTPGQLELVWRGQRRQVLTRD